MDIVILTRIGSQTGATSNSHAALQSIANLVPGLSDAGHNIRWILVDLSPPTQLYNYSAASLGEQHYANAHTCAELVCEALERKWQSTQNAIEPLTTVTPLLETTTSGDLRFDHAALIRDADLVITVLDDSCWRSDFDWIQRSCRGILAVYDGEPNKTVANLTTNTPGPISVEQLAAVDLYLTASGGNVVHEISRLGRVRFVRPLYPCFPVSPDSSETQPLYHLGCFANGHTSVRSEIETTLVSAAEELKWLDFAIAGESQTDREKWPSNIDYYHELGDWNYDHFLSHQRIVLDLIPEHSRRGGYCPSQTLVTAASLGIPVLSQAWPGMSQFFSPGQEILTYRSTDDIITILLTFSRDDLQEIGVAAKNRVIKQHSPESRVQDLEWFVDEVRTSKSLSCF